MSIAVRHGNEVLHTEQLGTTGTDAIPSLRTAPHSSSTINVRIPLPNSGGAMAYQEVTLGRNLGPYNEVSPTLRHILCERIEGRWGRGSFEQIVGNDLLELVGVWVAENARFSMWFATEAKAKAPSDKELAFLSLVSHGQARHVYEAWKRYVEAFGAVGGMAGDYDDEKLTLRDALLNAISTLTEARGRFDGHSSSAQ